eukprot:7712722-Pyramimonas_sp.AAC.1
MASSTRVAGAARRHPGAGGLQSCTWMRNLGHDHHGGKVSGNRTAQRLMGLAARRGRLLLFKRTVGHKVGCLWKTGLFPSAAHGAG